MTVTDHRLNVRPPASCLCRGAGTVSTPTRNILCPRCYGYGEQTSRPECERHGMNLNAAEPCLLCVFEASGATRVRSIRQILYAYPA